MTAAPDVYATVSDAMRAFLLTSHAWREGRPKLLVLCRDNGLKLERWTRDEATEREKRVLQVLASDLGFWELGVNPEHRPPAGVPGRVYSIGGVGQPTPHGDVTPPALERLFGSFEEAANAWRAAGKPRQRGSSVWLAEHEGVEMLGTVTIG